MPAARRFVLNGFAMLMAVLAISCGQSGDSADTPLTGNASADKIIQAVVSGDDGYVRQLWESNRCERRSRIGQPCVSEALGPTDEFFRCGVGSLAPSDVRIGISKSWALYSVSVEDSIGMTYTAIFSEGADPHGSAVILRFRTPKAGLESSFPTLLLEYTESCNTATDEWRAAPGTVVIPPPDERRR
jgi:hypothetical protein